MPRYVLEFPLSPLRPFSSCITQITNTSTYTQLLGDKIQFYTCGSRKAANGVKQVCVEMIRTNRSVSAEEAEALFEKVQRERYATDVFD